MVAGLGAPESRLFGGFKGGVWGVSGRVLRGFRGCRGLGFRVWGLGGLGLRV